MIDVKQAIEAAKTCVRDLFAAEQLSNLGLEEVEFDDARNSWAITIGFSRPWNTSRPNIHGLVVDGDGGNIARRSYKVVTIARDGGMISLKNRPTADAD